jgi:hypothetical protein
MIKNILAVALAGIVFLGLIIAIIIVLATIGVAIKYIAGYEITHWNWNLFDTVCMNILALSPILLFINYIRNKFFKQCKEEL